MKKYVHLELVFNLGLPCLLWIVTLTYPSLEIFYWENKTGAASL